MKHTVTLPDHLMDQVGQAMVDWSIPTMCTLSDRLQDMGVATTTSFQIEVQARLITAALVYVSFTNGVFDDEQSRSEWWQSACMSALDAGIEMYAEYGPQAKEGA